MPFGTTYWVVLVKRTCERLNELFSEISNGLLGNLTSPFKRLCGWADDCIRCRYFHELT
jgi:hypothetical protein